jgi:hypothetical protein
MPRFAVGNILEQYNGRDLLLFTANSVISGNGLVMGKGAALDFKRAFPHLPFALAGLMRERGIDSAGDFGLLVVNDLEGQPTLGAFQTKRHWKHPSQLEIIEASLERLSQHLLETDQTVHLNFPGVGLGKLNRNQVLPLLEGLPERVTIWSRPDDLA